MWLSIRQLDVIYQTFELFLILWTALCKEWNCDFWLPKVIHGDIHHAFVIWREIIFLLIFWKLRFFSVRQIFMRGTRLRLKHFDIVCMQQKFLCEPYLPSGKLPFWPFWEEKDMYSRRRALNAKELNTWVNDDQGNIDYWRHGKGECLKFHPNTPEFPNAVKQLRCSMVQ